MGRIPVSLTTRARPQVPVALLILKRDLTRSLQQTAQQVSETGMIPQKGIS
jgi:hypothetical protein